MFTIDEKTIETETISCGLCGGNEFARLLDTPDIRHNCKREYRLVRCRNCGFVLLNPRPTKETIANYYEADHPGKLHRKPAFYEKFYYTFFRNVPLRKKGKLLDIGCGSGAYLYVMRENGWNVKGVDVAYTDYARDILGLDIYEGGILDAKFKPESFDAITLWWALEHLYEPLPILKEAHRILKKGGVLLAGVPNITSLEAKLFGKYWFHLYVPQHLYQFSPDSLTKMLKRAGFGKVRIKHDLFSFGTIGSLQCFLNARGIRVKLTHPFFYIMSLPFDILLGVIKKSGLITAYAYKE